jgi:hypothetical protein
MKISAKLKIRRIFVCVGICVITMYELVSCIKPQFIVPGLTLPPNSTIVSLHNTPPKSDGLRGIIVDFNCPNGWDAVKQHIEQCMLRAGYREVSTDIVKLLKESRNSDQDSIEELNSVMVESATSEESQEYADMVKYSRVYRRSNSKYEVILVYTTGYLTSQTIKARTTGRDPLKHNTSDYCIDVTTIN